MRLPPRWAAASASDPRARKECRPIRYVEMALALSDDQFERVANDPWFRSALLSDIESAKMRLGVDSPGGCGIDYAGLTEQLGFVIDRDEAGYFALPWSAADLSRRVAPFYPGATAPWPVLRGGSRA